MATGILCLAAGPGSEDTPGARGVCRSLSAVPAKRTTTVLQWAGEWNSLAGQLCWT